MASKQPSHTTQTTKVELPKWVDEASQKNYAFAEQIANKPYNPYDGKTVAGVSQGTKDSWDMFYNTLGVGDKQRNEASDIFSRVGSSTAPTVTPKNLTDINLDDYLNPYIDNVESKALGALDRQRVQSLMQNADKAVSAGAFGGSRSGIVDGITNAQSALAAGDMSAQLRKQGFDTAVANATGDINRDFAGQQTNATNWLQNMAQQLQAGSGLLSAGQGMSDQRLKDIAGLGQIGQQQQMQEQRELDDAKGKWDAKENYDLERLNVLLSSLGMSPYGKTENTVKQSQGGSSGTDFAQMGLGIFSLLLGLSDRNEKTDIQKVGKDDVLGLDLYAYRYKGDPKSYPKVVGPMAQDVKKKYPQAVKEVNGKLVVDMNYLAGGLQ